MNLSIYSLFLLTLGAGLSSAYLVDPLTPAASDTVEDCSNWVIVAATDRCEDLANANSITLAQFQTYVSTLKLFTLVKQSDRIIESLGWIILQISGWKFLLH